ncbi:MAG: hypothetical protein P8183_17105, partial [Anaerolineae bacterium]
KISIIYLPFAHIHQYDENKEAGGDSAANPQVETLPSAPSRIRRVFTGEPNASQNQTVDENEKN